MKHTILANMNVKQCWWPLTFHKVVRQQIWGEVIVKNNSNFLQDSLSI